MNSANILLLLTLALVGLSCSEKETNLLDTLKLEKEVGQMFSAYDDTVRKNGIEAGLYFFDNSDQFYWVPPEYKYALHYDSIANLLREYSPQLRYVDNTWDTLHIMVLTETYASFNGIINSYEININNDTTITKLSETGLVIKRNNDWKFLSGQTVIIHE